jgi:DNA polymerase III epsilon subunit-like protein
MNGNMLAAIDLECTGLRAGYHDPIQLAIVPLDSDCKPITGVRPFYIQIKPLYPERADLRATKIHGLDINEVLQYGLHPDKVLDLLAEWVNDLRIPSRKKLVPLAHNWAYESSFLRPWLGEEMMDQMFMGHARDAMLFALSLNDRAFFAGEPVPFNTVSLSSLAKHFNIVNERPHDALCDALTEAAVYRAMLQM